jgi:hypothetical protein
MLFRRLAAFLTVIKTPIRVKIKVFIKILEEEVEEMNPCLQGQRYGCFKLQIELLKRIKSNKDFV